MTILSDIAFYIWILPVVAQIILPLGMLIVWLAIKPLRGLLTRQVDEASTIAALARIAAKKSA